MDKEGLQISFDVQESGSNKDWDWDFTFVTIHFKESTVKLGDLDLSIRLSKAP